MRGIARLLPACLAAAAVLASCGGGSDRVTTAPTTTSPTAVTGGTPTETTLGSTDSTVASADSVAATVQASDTVAGGSTATTAAGATTAASGTPSGGASTTIAGAVASSSSVKPTASTVKPSTSSSVAPATTAAVSKGGAKTITVDADQPPRTVSVAWGADVTLIITSAKVQDFHVHAPIDVELSGTSVKFQFSTDFGPSDMALLAGGDTLMAESHTTGKPVVYLVIG